MCSVYYHKLSYLAHFFCLFWTKTNKIVNIIANAPCYLCLMASMVELKNSTRFSTRWFYGSHFSYIIVYAIVNFNYFINVLYKWEFFFSYLFVCVYSCEPKEWLIRFHIFIMMCAVLINIKNRTFRNGFTSSVWISNLTTSKLNIFCFIWL